MEAISHWVVLDTIPFFVVVVVVVVVCCVVLCVMLCTVLSRDFERVHPLAVSTDPLADLLLDLIDPLADLTNPLGGYRDPVREAVMVPHSSPFDAFCRSFGQGFSTISRNSVDTRCRMTTA